MITDLGMPYVDGRQVATAIKTTAPSTPVVMLTGWGLTAGGRWRRAAARRSSMSKPPQLVTLRHVLGELTADEQPS